MASKISKLRSYHCFRSFLYRALKGGPMHRDKLINHLYRCCVNEFGVMRSNTAIITKAIYFPKTIGFNGWVNSLHRAGVLNRVKYRKCSKYTLGANGVKYLSMIYEESIAKQEQANYTDVETLAAQGIKENDMEKLQEEISEMNEKLKLIVSMLTPEQKLEIPTQHLKLVIERSESGH